MRSEATAEASLARMRERRKLGIAIAEMIKMTATTRSSSIREKPFCFLMSPPEASIRGTRALRRRNAVKIPQRRGGQALKPGLELKLVPKPNRGAWFATRDIIKF